MKSFALLALVGCLCALVINVSSRSVPANDLNSRQARSSNDDSMDSQRASPTGDSSDSQSSMEDSSNSNEDSSDSTNSAEDSSSEDARPTTGVIASAAQEVIAPPARETVIVIVETDPPAPIVRIQDPFIPVQTAVPIIPVVAVTALDKDG